MKQIPLTKGMFALVDDEDFDHLVQWKWHVQLGPSGPRPRRLVKTGLARPRQKPLLMYRVLLGLSGREVVDHVDGNPLNNQRVNLRIATNGQNLANAKLHANNTSGFKGVGWHHNAWKATIRVHGKQQSLGRFNEKLSAARAYDEAAIRLFGEFAKTNHLMGLI